MDLFYYSLHFQVHISLSFKAFFSGYDNFYGEGNLVYDPENYLFFRRPYRSGRLQVVRLKRASTPRQQRSEASDRLQVIRLKRGVDGALKVVRL